MAAQPSIITRDVDKIAGPTGNLYESVVVISKRARQIAVNLKEELNGKLAEFATTVDNLEEVFENREQIEISKFYERMPKPTTTDFAGILLKVATPLEAATVLVPLSVSTRSRLLAVISMVFHLPAALSFGLASAK